MNKYVELHSPHLLFASEKNNQRYTNFGINTESNYNFYSVAMCSIWKMAGDYSRIGTSNFLLPDFWGEKFQYPDSLQATNRWPKSQRICPPGTRLEVGKTGTEAQE